MARIKIEQVKATSANQDKDIERYLQKIDSLEREITQKEGDLNDLKEFC